MMFQKHHTYGSCYNSAVLLAMFSVPLVLCPPRSLPATVCGGWGEMMGQVLQPWTHQLCPARYSVFFACVSQLAATIPSTN